MSLTACTGDSDRVAHAAHVGGAAFGLSAALIVPLAAAAAQSLSRALERAQPAQSLARAGPGQAGPGLTRTVMGPW